MQLLNIQKIKYQPLLLVTNSSSMWRVWWKSHSSSLKWTVWSACPHLTRLIPWLAEYTTHARSEITCTSSCASCDCRLAEVDSPNTLFTAHLDCIECQLDWCALIPRTHKKMTTKSIKTNQNGCKRSTEVQFWNQDLCVFSNAPRNLCRVKR